MKTWKVTLTETGMEFRKGGKDGLELSPHNFFNDISPRKRVLRLGSRDIGMRLASEELSRIYGEDWIDLVL